MASSFLPCSPRWPLRDTGKVGIRKRQSRGLFTVSAKLFAAALLLIALHPARGQKEVEPCDKLEFNRLKLRVIYQEQMLWLCKDPNKKLPQNPCSDADLKETCSVTNE